MEPRRFDDFVRKLERGAGRRDVLRLLVGGGLASAFSLLRSGGTNAAELTSADARCRGAGENCQSDAQCCAERCIRDQDGARRCTCKGPGGSCFVDRGCCSGRCRRNGKCR